MPFIALVCVWSQHGCRDCPDATGRGVSHAADHVLAAGAARKQQGVQQIIDGLGMTAEKKQVTGRRPKAAEHPVKPVT
jgi:hypothetical protein